MTPDDTNLAQELKTRPSVIWVFSDLTPQWGAETTHSDVSFGAFAANAAADVERLLADAMPRVRLRVEDLSSEGDLIDREVSFRSIHDFSLASLAERVPEIGRAMRAASTPARRSVARGGSAIELAIQAALRGETAPTTNVDREAEEPLLDRQAALIRGFPPLLALESRWRSLLRLAQAIEGERRVTLHVLPLSERLFRRELERFDRGEDSWFDEIVDRQIRDPRLSPELIVADFAFGARPEDVASLRSLGGLAAAVGVPALASVTLPFESEASVTLTGTRAAFAVDSLVRSPQMAAFRTLRQDPRAVLLALVVGVLSRTEPLTEESSRSPDGEGRWSASRDSVWEQSGAMAVAERLLARRASSGGYGLGEARLGTTPALGVHRLPALKSSAVRALAEAGVIGLGSAIESGNDGRDLSLVSEAGLPMMSIPPSALRDDASPTERFGHDLRHRITLSRLAILVRLAARSMGLPSSRDASAVQAWCDRIANALSPSVSALLERPDPTDRRTVVHAVFESVDERSLRLGLQVDSPSAASSSRYCDLRVATYPFAD